MLSRHALWSPGLLFCNKVGGEFHFAWVCLEASHGQVLFFCKEAEPRGFVISAPPPRKDDCRRSAVVMWSVAVGPVLTKLPKDWSYLAFELELLQQMASGSRAEPWIIPGPCSPDP